MADYKLSGAADQDIDRLYEYSLLEFGERVSDVYLDGLFHRFELLAEHPDWGNDYGHIAPGLRRYEHKSHSIYYLCSSERQILIVRVLGRRQDPGNHL